MQNFLLEKQRLLFLNFMKKCDSATLARDLKKLEEMGYRAEKVQMVDMFPQTRHVECVVLIQRKHI